MCCFLQSNIACVYFSLVFSFVLDLPWFLSLSGLSFFFYYYYYYVVLSKINCLSDHLNSACLYRPHFDLDLFTLV